MILMQTTTTQNEKLKKILNDRQTIMETLLYGEDLDDERLSEYYKFMKWYDSLSQLDKDIFYLIQIYGIPETAQLLDCSYSFIYSKSKKLKYKK